MTRPVSWRRADAVAVDPATGTAGAAAQPLLETDAGSVTVLHLDPGGSVAPASDPVGALVVVLAGSGLTTVDGERIDLRAGDAIRWPAEAPHELTTDDGMSLLVLTYPETRRSWRVARVDAQGRRWVCGVFSDTERARAYREGLRATLPEGEDAVLE